MDEGCYNTYTISDSDDSVTNVNRITKYETSRKDNDCLSSEEEPEFFLQVLQRVRFELNEFYNMMLNELKLLHIIMWFFF